MHALATMFALLIFFACCIYRYRTSFVDILKKSIVIMPVAILIILWWNFDKNNSDRNLLTYLLFDRYRAEDIIYDEIIQRAGIFVLDNYHLYDGILGYAVALLFTLTIIMPVIWRLLLNRKLYLANSGTDQIAYLYIFILVSIFCYLFIPNGLLDPWGLFMRFSAILLITIIIWGGVITARRIYRVEIIAICFVCILHLALYADYFWDFQKENQAFTEDIFPRAA